MCKKPYMSGVLPFGCGQCLPCRINRSRQWAARQTLESYTHEHCCFVTLTLDDAHLGAPTGHGEYEVSPLVLQLFLKRLRYYLGRDKIRFFAVGEYGEAAGRPHYHINVFGMSGHSLHQNGRYARTGAECVRLAWSDNGVPKGHIMVGDFTEATAQYVSKYVVKKWTNKDHKDLNGRHPEFARMSLRPCIGGPAMQVLAETISNNGELDRLDDVPNVLKLGKKSLPLGRTMIRKLREATGFSEDYVQSLKSKVSYERSLEMLALFENYEPHEEVKTLRAAFAKSVSQRILQLEAKSKIYSQVRKL